MLKNMFKTKKFWVILIIILIATYIGYGQYKKATALPNYDTVAVMRGNLVQTVEATGKLQSASDLQLKFETAGTLDNVAVKEGDVVKTGTLLASLKASELNAAVAQAQANLNQKIAGANDQDRAYYAAAADAAKADWEKTQSDTNNSVSTYESALETAKNNLRLAEGGENSLVVIQEYNDAVAVLQASLGKVDDGITQADNILGVDNTLATDAFDDLLSSMDPDKLKQATANYLVAKSAREQFKLIAISINTATSHSIIDQAITLAEDALAKTGQLLANVSDVLTATPPVGRLTQSTLDSKKTIIASTRAAVSAQYTTTISEEKALTDAKNSYSTYQVAYNKAFNDLTNAQKTASSIITIKEAAYKQAKANLENKLNPPREVDLAPLRAALAQAAANRDKAFLRAPMDGVVTKINKKKGEFLTAADVAVDMVSPSLEIYVDIPETDVPKLKLGDSVGITLDAFGDETKFIGKVISIDPASTDIQDVVYYKVKVSLDSTDKPIKPGMTANVTISTEQKENALYVPSRAIRTNSEKYVKVLVGKDVKDVPVKLGLKADDGRIEILEGINEGDLVIIGTK